MKKLLLILLTVVLLLPAVMRAQSLGDYYFSTGTDASKWIPLTTTTSIITPGAGDYGVSAVCPIGFTFTFGEESFSSFSVNADGNLKLGSTVTGTGNYSIPFNATNANANNPKINMLGCDGYLTSDGHVYYEVVGTAPNRICVIEFATSTYNSTSRAAVLKWQVQLFEGSNDIQIVYPSTAPTILPNVARQPGMCVSDSDIVLINANHRVDAFDAGVSANNIDLGNWPDTSRYYLFTIPATVCNRPTNLAATNITENSAHIAWTGTGSEQDFDIYITDQNDSPDENTTPTATLTTTSYDATGLTGVTRYIVYVRANCGNNYSNWRRMEFFTACPDYMNLPYAETFDSYGTGTAATCYPSCWTRLTNYSTQYPYISATTPSSAPGCLYFYSSSYSNYYSCAITPEIDTTINPINTLTVSFKIKKSSTSTGYGALQVGVMTDPTNISTFTPVQTYTGSEWANANTWYEVEIPFTNYTGGGSHIAMYVPSTATTYTYVDDFEVYPTPTCLKPTNVVLSNITDNSVEVGWTSRSNEMGWQVAVVPHGTSVDLATPENVYSNPCTINNLTDNTQYDVYVKADCGGGDESPWTSAVSFYTRCLPASTMPFTESFDTYGTGTAATSYPNCWGRMTNYTTQYPYINTTHYDGVGSLYFYSTSTYYSLATSQALDLSNYAAGELMLTFKAKKSSAEYGRLDVGVMTEASNLSTMTVLKSIYSIDYANTTDWETFRVILPDAYTNGNVYLAFLSPTNSSDTYVYVDAVTLDYAPTCMGPENLQVENVSGSTVQLSWEDPIIVPSSYTVEYSESDLDNWSIADANVVGTTATITGLTMGSPYDVRVYANCSGTDTATITFSTRAYLECVGQSVLTDEITSATTTTGYYVPVSSFFKYCYTQQIYTADEIDSTHTPTLITGLSFQYNYSSPTTEKTNVNMYLAHRATNSFASTTDWTPISSATLVYSGSMNCSQGWNNFTFDTPFSYNGTDNLVVIIDDNSNDYDGSSYVYNLNTPGTSAPYPSMYYQSDSSNPDPTNPPTGTRYASRPDIKFSLCDQAASISCAAPVITGTTTDVESITIDWIPGMNESAWTLEYKAENDSSWTSEGTVTTYPYTISNLLANTNYSVRLKSDCGGGDFSDWVTADALTECTIITTLPFIENFETADGSGAGHFLNCWRKGTNSTTAYPYTSSTYKHAGTYSLYLYGTSSFYSYAATPRFDDDINMSNLQISFYAYKTSAAYKVEVGIMTDPTDYSTFELIGSFMPTETSTWEMAEIGTTQYTGNGHYIAFRMPMGTSNAVYVDDIDIHEMPFCGRVTDITDTLVTENSATITWTPGGNETSWEVLYGLNGTVDFENDIPITTYVPSIDLTNLSASSAYDVFVRIDCGNGEYGAWTLANFRTSCGAITTLPYVENFDTYGTGNSAYPDCWSKINHYITTTNLPYVKESGYNGSTGLLYFYTTTSSSAPANPYVMAISPAFDVTIPVNTLQITFMYKASSATNRLVVGVMNSPTDTASFVPVDTVAPASTASTWIRKEISLANYTGTGRHIALKNAYNGSSCYSYVDNFNVDLIPSCPRPSNVTAMSTASDSVMLSWSDATGSQWDVIYGPTGFNPDTSTNTIIETGFATTSCVITGLTPDVIYDFYVRSDCGGGDVSPWSYEPSSASPYTITMGVTGSRTVTGCGMTITDDGGPNGDYSNNCDYTLTILPSDPDSLIVISGTFQGEGSSYDYLSVYDGTTTNSANLIRKITSGTSGTTVNFGPFTSEYGPLTLHFYSDVSNTYDGFAINVNCVAAPTCRKPLQVAVVSTSSSDATISWTTMTNSYSGFNVAVSTTANFNPDTCSNVNTSYDTTYNITGLNDNTTYYVKVQTDCGSGDVSDWSDAIAVTTTCAPVTTLPFSENFDSHAGSTSTSVSVNNLPSCWDHICGTYSGYAGYPIVYNSTTYAASGTNALRFYTSTVSDYGNQYAILPIIDVVANPLNNLQLTLDVRKNSTTYASFTMYVGVMTDASDASTFVPVDTIVTTSNTYAEYTVYFTNYTGTGDRIALMAPNISPVSYNTGYVDNVVLEYMPSCPKPQDLIASNATTTSVDLSWTEIGSAAAWNIEYGPAGFTQGSGTRVAATSNPFTLTGLNAATNYDFYVQANCGGGDTSAWSTVANAATACDIMTLPYTENFDSYTGTAYNVVGTAPVCWVTTTTNTTYPAPHITNGGSYSYPNSAPNAMTFTCGSAGSDAYAVLPEFTDALNSIILAFAYKMENTSYGTMTVGYVTDVDNIASSFQTIATLNSTTTITHDTVSFVDVPANTTGRLAFHWNHGASFYSCCIDDISAFTAGSIPTTCDVPTALVVNNITTTTATATWTAGGSETAWDLQYKLASANDWGTVIPVSAHTYNFTGLTANTQYVVRVRANCGDSQSAWTSGVSFTTQNNAQPGCEAPTNLSASSVTANSVVLSWTENGTATSWTVNYKESGVSTWSTATANATTYTLTGLNPETAYSAYVVANCADGNSGASNTVTFATLSTGIEDYAVSTLLFPNPTNGQIVIRTSEVTMTTVGIYDVYGKLLKTVEVNGNEANIDVTGYASGMYFARIATEKGVVTKSFVKK